jgi:hypothetical protein
VKGALYLMNLMAFSIWCVPESGPNNAHCTVLLNPLSLTVTSPPFSLSRGSLSEYTPLIPHTIKIRGQRLVLKMLIGTVEEPAITISR